MGTDTKTMKQLLAEVNKEAADALETETQTLFNEEEMNKISEAVIQKGEEVGKEGNDDSKGGAGATEVGPEVQKLANSILAKADTPEKKQNLVKLATQLLTEEGVSTKTIETGIDKEADEKIDEVIKIANIEGRAQAQLFIMDKVAEAIESGELVIPDGTEEEKEAAVGAFVKKLLSGAKAAPAKIKDLLKMLAAKGKAAPAAAKQKARILKSIAKRHPGLIGTVAGAGAGAGVGGTVALRKALGLKKKGSEVVGQEKEASEDEKILATFAGQTAAWTFTDEINKIAQAVGAAAPEMAAPTSPESQAALQAAVSSTEGITAAGEDPSELAAELIEAVEANPEVAAAELVEAQSPEHAAQVIAESVVTQAQEKPAATT